MATKLVSIALSALAGAGIATLVFTATPLQAQNQTGWWPMGRPMMGNGWQRGGPMGPRGGGMSCRNGGMFNADDLVTLQGTATAVNRYGSHQGMFLTLQTAQETLEVHLGPAWYLEDQGFAIVPNSPVEVKGFRSDWQGESVLMASEVTQGDRVLQLRDADGYPIWMQQATPSR
jgi:hypothetical protein